ncbi:MAG: GspE/PulE family protein, partial [Candidatus Sumerlaeaceae bacterium]
EDEREADFSYYAPGIGRFRTNVFQQRGEFCFAMRHVKTRVPSFEELGLPDILKQIAETQRGIVIVAGPSGCGKSTTLAAMIEHINANFKKHIITLEDPIEYLFEDNQSVIEQREIGLDTASYHHALKHVLRQDPDVIMVGETRDPETAQAAIRAALTGHLVFSTLHTNDAAGAVSRLLDMGIEPFLVASSVEGLIAQRLVRVLCPDCKVPFTLSPEVLNRLRVNKLDTADAQFMRPAGCEKCRYTGFRGRTAIYEIIKVTEDLKQMIVARRPSNEIKQAAIASGMRTIREDGWLKVRAGLTTIDEVLRVTMEDEFGGVGNDE